MFARPVLFMATAAGVLFAQSRPSTPVQPGDFTVTVMTTGLDTPWDLAWGPG